jgi:uncharacterized protein DUF5985
MHPFLEGVAACGSFVAGVLFFRFWRELSEPLFLWFGLAFWMFALNWSAIATAPLLDETGYLYFLPRLAGFLLILVGIVVKNRAPSR